MGRQLAQDRYPDQDCRARRRATLTDLLDTRFQGISSFGFEVAAMTPRRKRDFDFMSHPARFCGDYPIPEENSAPLRH
ncbi:hypothetical protein [Ruegeria intermedia]|uniref:hypothetical protein n=1 Tax=Ruegeria intermedia TaxID=996115 RepID=UPI00165F0006|nr:hypothetical protein [Ruegeria intermedia]